MTNQPEELQWKVDECSSYFDRMRLQGWCFFPGKQITRVEVLFPAASTPLPLVSYGLPSPDVARTVAPDAHHVRFAEWVPLPAAQQGRDFTLRLHLTDGSVCETSSVRENARVGDDCHGSWLRFLNALETFDTGDVLEIGSRARSAITRRHRIPAKLGYVGVDILPGPNVDIVGDAHSLSALLGPRKFVAAFSHSVFEHLAMPWKVAIEINRVLVPGGVVFVNTHQTWPLHELPWDFWRFSAQSWQCLFNQMTGFELVETAHGEPARVHPLWDAPALRGLEGEPAYLHTTVIARKIAETTLAWPVPTAMAAPGCYPHGELAEPPH